MTTVIAITGGIGSGKSTFSKELIKRGLSLLDSDKQVADIYKRPSKEFQNHLLKIGLGESIKNKKIDKKRIAKIIFSNPEIKIKLEKYIFTVVRFQRRRFINDHKKRKTKIIFLDIPLLFENALQNDFDIIISIISKREQRYKRLKKNKKISRELFKKILKNQTSDIERKRNSNIVLFNNDTLTRYKKKINKLLDLITV